MDEVGLAVQPRGRLVVVQRADGRHVVIGARTDESLHQPRADGRRAARTLVAGHDLVQRVLVEEVGAAVRLGIGAKAVERRLGVVPVARRAVEDGAAGVDPRRVAQLVDVVAADRAGGKPLPAVRHATDLEVVVLVPIDGVEGRRVEIDPGIADVRLPQAEPARELRPGREVDGAGMEAGPVEVEEARTLRLLRGEQGALEEAGPRRRAPGRLFPAQTIPLLGPGPGSGVVRGSARRDGGDENQQEGPSPQPAPSRPLRSRRGAPAPRRRTGGSRRCPSASGP